MEELNMLAADCVVVSCCCQCLVLQILIYILLKLPYKFVRRTKRWAQKLRNGKREEKRVQRERRRYENDSFRSLGSSFRIRFEGFALDEWHSFGCCIDEVDNVLEELSNRGAFAFGSFWDEEVSWSLSSCLAKQELDYDVVQYHLIKAFGDSNHL